jgi:hypothetical protein
LLVLERRRALPENGLFYVQGLLLCATRVALEPFREASAFDAWAVNVACLAGLTFFAFRLNSLRARRAIAVLTQRLAT